MTPRRLRGALVAVAVAAFFLLCAWALERAELVVLQIAFLIALASLLLGAGIVYGIRWAGRFADGIVRENRNPVVAAKFPALSGLQRAGFTFDARLVDASGTIGRWPIRASLMLDGRVRVRTAGLPSRMRIGGFAGDVVVNHGSASATQALEIHAPRMLARSLLRSGFEAKRGRASLVVEGDAADPVMSKDILEAAVRLAALCDALEGGNVLYSVTEVAYSAVPELRRAAIRVLDSPPFARGELPASAAVDEDETVRLAYALRAQRPLPPEHDLLCLHAREEPDVRLDALAALALVGSVETIRVLRGAQAASEREREVGHRTIATIQARVEIAAGHLSLAKAQGELSIPAEAGMVSMAKKGP